MPPFRYEAFVNPYIGSISELMGKGDEAKAQALLRIGEIQARAEEQRGQAWGNAVQGLGNIASKAITDYNDPKAREARAIDKAQKILDVRSKELVTGQGQRLIAGTLQPGSTSQEFVVPESRGIGADVFGRTNFGAGSRPNVTTDETFALAQADPNGQTIDNALPNEGLRNALSRSNAFRPTERLPGNASSVAQAGMQPNQRSSSFGSMEERITPPRMSAPKVETYDKAPRNRYTTAQGLYDVRLAYEDLVKAGVSTKIAIALAGQGQQANSIFAAYDKDKEELDKKQIAVRGSIANMAIQLMDTGMSAQDALTQASGPAGNRISQDDMNAFAVQLNSQPTEQDKKNLFLSEVEAWDAQGKKQVVNPGDYVLNDNSGTSKQFGTRPVSAADQLFSQNLRDYKKAVINGSTESSYANWLASEGRAPDKLTPNELALDSFAQSLGKKDRSSLTDADFQKYAKRENLANDDPRIAMLRDLTIAAAEDKALTARQVRDDEAAFNRLPMNVQNAASTIGLRMPSDVARNNLNKQLARAPDEASQLRRLRVAIIPAGEAGLRYASRQTTIDALDVIQSTLAELRAMPGASIEGPLSGNLEKIAKAFGTSRNTKYQELGARIGNALINYRKGITGAAFSREEAKGYKDLFSDYTNTPALTDAILSGFRSALKDDVISNYKMFLGGDESAESLARVLAEPNVSNSGSGRQIGARGETKEQRATRIYNSLTGGN